MNVHDPRIDAIPDCHGHVKGEHRPYAEERPIPYTARMLFLWFYHACVRGAPRFMMASDHMNVLTFEDPAAVHSVRRALKLASAGDLYGAAETANVDVAHAAAVSEGLRRRNMRFSIGAEVDNDPRCRPDAANIVEAMRPDGMVRAVHFLTIDHPTQGPGFQWAYDYPEFVSLYDHVGTEALWKLYAETVYSTIETQPGQIFAHFYKPAIFGHWPAPEALESYEDRFVELCAQREIAIEFNSRIFYKSDDEAQIKRFREANLRLLKKAKAANVMIAAGSDAHSPRDQGGGFAAVLELLDEAEINELAFPIAGRLARVALRVPKEPERPAPPPAPPATAPAHASATAAEAAVPAAKKKRAPRPAPVSKAKAAPETVLEAVVEAVAEVLPSALAARKGKAVSLKEKVAALKEKAPALKVKAPALKERVAALRAKVEERVPKDPPPKKDPPAKEKAGAKAKAPAPKAPAPAAKTKTAGAKAKPAAAKPKAAPAKAAQKKAVTKTKLTTAKPSRLKPAAKAPAAKKAAGAKAAAKTKARSKPLTRTIAKKTTAAAKKATGKKVTPAKSRPAKSAAIQRKAPALKKRTKSRR